MHLILNFVLIFFRRNIRVYDKRTDGIAIYIHIKILKQELKTVKVNSEKHTQVYGMYRAV